MIELPPRITDYLDTLTDAEQDRVLVSKMGEAGAYIRGDGCRCLVGTVRDYRSYADTLADAWRRDKVAKEFYVGCCFDTLCREHGDAEVGAAIRDYLLRGMLRPTPMVELVER